MAQLEIQGPYHPLGPDGPRTLQDKLNHNYAELCAAAGVPAQTVHLTPASGQPDTPRTLEAKLNSMNRALAAAAGAPAPAPVSLSYAPASYGVYAGAAPVPTAATAAAALRSPAALLGVLAALRGVQAPAPPPVLPLRVALEGDSYSTSLFGYAGLWPSANPAVPFTRHASSGASIATLAGRLDSVIADQPSILTALVGANDLRGAASAEDYVARLLAYFAAAKAKRPGLTTVAAEVMPIGTSQDNGKHALYRPTVNALLRQAVGQGSIDALIPFGTHPAMTDAAANNPDYYSSTDWLHPTGLTYDIMFRVYSAVLNPLVAGATATSPAAPSFTAEANRELATAYTSNLAYVTGMRAGASVTLATAGAGASAVGQGPFSTAAKQVINGDVVRLRQTSAAAGNTATTTTVTLGATTAAYTVTTKVAAPITAVAGDVFTTATGFATVKTFDMPLLAGRPVFAVELDGSAGYDASSLTINGKPCAKAANGGGMFIFIGPEELPAGTHQLVYSSSGNAVNSLQLMPVALANAGTAAVGTAALLAWGYKADGLHTAASALAVGSGGIGVLFYYNNAALDGSTFTKAADQTLLKSYGNRWHALVTTTSGAPAVTSKQAGTDCMVAVAVNP